MSQSSKSAIPKFGSFKPKINQPAPAPPEGKEQDREDRASPPGHRQKHRNHDKDRRPRSSGKHHDRRHDRERRRDRSIDRQQLEQSSSRSAVTRNEPEESDLFIIDRRGDAKNVEFGGIHRYDIPAYLRAGRGGIIGLSNGERIDRDQSDDKIIVLRPRMGNSSGRNSRPLLDQRRAKKGERRMKLIVPTQTPHPDSGQDFLAMPFKKRKVVEDFDDGHVGHVDYRSIEGKAKPPEQPQDGDLQYASDSDGDGIPDPAYAQIQQKNAELSRIAKENPMNLQAWLDLIDHQDHIIRSSSADQQLTPADRRTLADIRLNIVNKALRHIPQTHTGHDQLVLRMLESGAVIWDSTKLESKWEQALKDSKSSLLWIKYLDLVQTNAATFNYTRCRQAYIDCLKALDETPPGAEDSIGAKLFVFLRLTCFIRDAGFYELAYSLWQALLEYVFCRPSDLAHDRALELDALEDWWESEVPRIGENECRGWAYYHIHGFGGARRRPDARNHFQNAEATTSPFLTELKTEASWSGLCLPAAADDGGIDDPYRHVMFSDLRDSIECMLGTLPQTRVLDAWLCFMGLPPLPEDPESGSGHQMAWNADQFTRTWNTKLGLWNQKWTLSTLCQVYPLPQDLDADEMTIGFIQRTLLPVADRATYDERIEAYNFAFWTHIRGGQAKEMLSQFNSAGSVLSHFCGQHALIAAWKGNMHMACTAMKAALAETLDDSSQTAWSDWESLMTSEDDDESPLQVLLGPSDAAFKRPFESSPQIEPVSAGQVLRIKQDLEERFDANVFKSKPVAATVFAELLAWLTYLASAQSVDSALAVFSRCEARLDSYKQSSSVATELLHQARALLIVHHIHHKRPHKPALVRDVLLASLKLFPENSILIETLVQARGMNNLEDRIREAVNTIKTTMPEMALTAIYHQLKREIAKCEAGSASSHSVRRLFTSTLVSTEGPARHSSVIWWMWLEYEVGQLNSDVAITGRPSPEAKQAAVADKAKQVFYNALRMLPWNKRFAIRGLDLLCQCDLMDEDEARSVVRVMDERHLRPTALFDL